MAGEVGAAITELERVHTLAPTLIDTIDNLADLADIYDNLGWAYAAQGNRPSAMRYLKRADTCWQAPSNQGRRALTLNNMEVMAMEDGRCAEARTTFNLGLEIAQQTGLRREETVLLCSLAELDLREGDFEQAIQRFTAEHLKGALRALGASPEPANAALYQQLT